MLESDESAVARLSDLAMLVAEECKVSWCKLFLSAVGFRRGILLFDELLAGERWVSAKCLINSEWRWMTPRFPTNNSSCSRNSSSMRRAAIGLPKDSEAATLSLNLWNTFEFVTNTCIFRSNSICSSSAFHTNCSAVPGYQLDRPRFRSSRAVGRWRKRNEIPLLAQSPIPAGAAAAMFDSSHRRISFRDWSWCCFVSMLWWSVMMMGVDRHDEDDASFFVQSFDTDFARRRFVRAAEIWGNMRIIFVRRPTRHSTRHASRLTDVFLITYGAQSPWTV